MYALVSIFLFSQRATLFSRIVMTYTKNERKIKQKRDYCQEIKVTEPNLEITKIQKLY